MALDSWLVMFYLNLTAYNHFAFKTNHLDVLNSLLAVEHKLFTPLNLLCCDSVCFLTAPCRWGGEECVPVLSTWGGWTSCHVIWDLQSWWSEETRKTSSPSTANKMSLWDQCTDTELQLITHILTSSSWFRHVNALTGIGGYVIL